MTVDDPGFWLAVIQIIWIDLLLSGDNAVVIALACRKLPPRQRAWGIALGTLVAIGLRVIFTGLITTLMTMAYVKLIGGLLLLWIAIKLLGGEEESANDNIESVNNLWHAVRIIAIADAVMSLDNVIAIAMAARGNYALLMFGLAVSIPLIMVGAAIVMSLLERFPIIVWAGAALLGWIAGEIIAKDPLITGNIDPAHAHTVWIAGATLGAVFVVGVGLIRRRWRGRTQLTGSVDGEREGEPERPDDRRAAPPVVGDDVGHMVGKANGGEPPREGGEHRPVAGQAPIRTTAARAETLDDGK
jgi:YjbE family integral membrane protein